MDRPATSYDTVYGVGRALSALADLGTIVFAWLLARRVFGVRTAHLTALLLAMTVLHIQLAHFFAVDTFVACFAAGALFFGQRAWQRESLVDALLAGVFVGLATACKISAAAAAARARPGVRLAAPRAAVAAPVLRRRDGVRRRAGRRVLRLPRRRAVRLPRPGGRGACG